MPQSEITKLLEQMTLEEKAGLCSGKNFWNLKGVERLNIPSVMITDGPHGLRKQNTASDHLGIGDSVPAVCFPTASALASSWDKNLLREIGAALGEKSAHENVAVLLGPGMNIKRHPSCGRNFEYFSEDPLLTGELAAAMIDGIQSHNVGACIKHFAVNNHENGRMIVDVLVDERTLHEIYLKGFEIAVKKSRPWMTMCAYNRLNGIYCSDHRELLTDILRDQWGFDGVVVTDWGAMNERVSAIRAGLDLEMPASGGENEQKIIKAVQAGELNKSDLDKACINILSMIFKSLQMRRAPSIDEQQHHLLAQRAAEDSAVLLKNDSAILPLAATKTIAIIGEFAKSPRYQGAGSSRVNPTQVDCAFDRIKDLLDSDKVLYAENEEDAVKVARAADCAIIFAGLPSSYESEGFDREHLRLPEQHDRLITEVARANPNSIVVLMNGAPVLMPWLEAPKAILECYLGGQAGGAAIANLLFGQANPSGKLAETFPLSQTDIPSDRYFLSDLRQSQYREGLYVGYRYFDTMQKPVLFPFGHGLSYAQFEYKDLVLSKTSLDEGEALDIAFQLTNSGTHDGKEIVQLYVRDVDSTLHRPAHELKAFEKINLKAGETKSVKLKLDADAFSYFDPASQQWAVEEGAFEIQIAASSRDVRLAQTIVVHSSFTQTPPDPAEQTAFTGSQIEVSHEAFAAMLKRPIPDVEPIKPYHLNSALGELRTSFIGNRFRKMVVKRMLKTFGSSSDDTSSDNTMTLMVKRSLDGLPLRALVLLSGGQFTFRTMNRLLDLFNGHYLKFLIALWRSDRK